MDHTRFIKVTDENGDRIMINIDVVYRLHHIKSENIYRVIMNNGVKTSITKEQFEEFWG